MQLYVAYASCACGLFSLIMAVKFETAKKWEQEFNPQKEWLVVEGDQGEVLVSCSACTKFEERLKLQIRNFNPAFIFHHWVGR